MRSYLVRRLKQILTIFLGYSGKRVLKIDNPLHKNTYHNPLIDMRNLKTLILFAQSIKSEASPLCLLNYLSDI